ncbi:MAG: helix-turn-helix transcriptional regulator [Oscillospiraceae bacterium]|nr:helix-turn-helix transcriptional regulator [Clostridia bacterium]MBQ8620651.1 helix-turn-helix transcriptional regulator [Clostridia bacterium]MBQ9167504.1 helix-turn-helix transcriptional regulator [Oscillospiraceae bacterium]
MQEYWEIIRALREDRDLKQADIAAVLGTTQQVYSRYEKGINEMPIRHLITLCQYYHVSADYILGLSKKMK